MINSHYRKFYLAIILGFLLAVGIIIPVVVNAQTTSSNFCVAGAKVEGKSSPAKQYICQNNVMHQCSSGNVCLAGRCQPENYNKLDLFAPFKPELKTIIFVSGAGEPSPNLAWKLYQQFGNKFNFVYFTYDYSQRTEVTARDLNNRIKQILVAYPNQEFKIVAHSMGHLVARTAILMANGFDPPGSTGLAIDSTLATAYSNSEFYSIAGLIGGQHDAYKWAPPDFLPIRYNEFNPTGQFQTWLFSADRVQNFNFEVKGYHSFDAIGDPHLIDLADCGKPNISSRLKTWCASYDRGKSPDHGQFNLINRSLTSSSYGGFIREEANAMIGGMKIVWGTADRNFCQNNNLPIYTLPTTGADGHSALLFHPAVIAKIVEISPTLKVLAPNGGEQISKSVPYQVRWTTNNISSTQLIKIRLLNSQGGVAYQNSFPNTGSRDFLFASQPPGQYKIELSATVNGETVTDQSDGFFTLTGDSLPAPDTTPPDLYLIAPNLGTTIINKATSILIQAFDTKSGVESLSIGVRPPGVANTSLSNPLLKICDKPTSPSYADCMLSVAANNWVVGTLVVITATDNSPNHNFSFEAFVVTTTGQLGKQNQTGSKIIVPPTPQCHTFNTNLSIGMSGSEVSVLQTTLTRAGFSVTATGNFDEVTASAVSSFQLAHKSELLTANGLIYPTGYFGQATRQKLNSLWGCG